MANDSRPEIFVPANSPIYVPGTVRRQVVPARSAPAPQPARPLIPPPAPAKVIEFPSHRLAPPPERRRTEWPEQPRRKRRDPARQPAWMEIPPEEEDGDDGTPANLTVPPEIFALAEEAARSWSMSVTGWQLAATKPEKGWGAIWRIETDRGPRSIKLLHRPFERNLFSIHAQQYVTERKGRVAPLIRTKNGQLWTIVQGRMFIVTEWIDGLHPASKVTVEGAQQLCEGLAEFHRFTQGYVPPPQAYYASRMQRWPGVYRKMRTKIDWFEHLARAYSDMPASRLLLEVLPRFRSHADQAIARLERSAYRKLVARGDQAWGLVHQDEGSERESHSIRTTGPSSPR